MCPGVIPKETPEGTRMPGIVPKETPEANFFSCKSPTSICSCNSSIAFAGLSRFRLYFAPTGVFCGDFAKQRFDFGLELKVTDI